jgi:hypothetical protein
MELRETVDAVTSLGDLVASQLYEDRKQRFLPKQ